MDQLGKALIEAIHAGQNIAPTLLWGYYLVRALEAVAAPLTFFGIAVLASFTVRFCVATFAANDAAKDKATWAQRDLELKTYYLEAQNEFTRHTGHSYTFEPTT